MRRRELLLVGLSAPLGWASHAYAQQGKSTRRVAILHDYQLDDPEGQAQIAAFREELGRLGWVGGDNLEVEVRPGAVESDLLHTAAAEVIALKPDVILAAGGTIVAALQRESREVPIVFVNVTDPVGGGLVNGIARPGGNTTGFTQFEFGLSAKWLELLKEVAPEMTRVAVVRDPAARSGGGQLGAIQVAASSFHVDVRPVDPRDAHELEQRLSTVSREHNVGLIVTTSRLARIHRSLILSLATRYQWPAIYAFRVFVADGGLMSYGPSSTEPYRRSASYVDRILRGETPSNMPVQIPSKYELAINLKAARAIGITVPQSLLSRADEVIE